MIGRTNAGGGANLNFKVVGGAVQPENPGENTLWINTDVGIEGWTFAADEDGAAEGEVWFPTGSNSQTPFNALKKNSVTVYPLTAKQYVNGAWVDKTAKIYQNGAWNELWNGKLYDHGDEYVYITGGFVEAFKNSYGTRTFTKNEDSLYFKSTGTTGSGAHVYASTEKKINLNGFSTLSAKIKHTSSSSTSFYLAAHTLNDEPAYNVPCVVKQSSSKEGVVSLDISGLSGEHYILLGLGGNAASNNGNCYVYEVYLT